MCLRKYIDREHTQSAGHQRVQKLPAQEDWEHWQWLLQVTIKQCNLGRQESRARYSVLKCIPKTILE